MPALRFNQEQVMSEPKDSGSWPDPEQERAQPGDVLGIERGGETTSLGDTDEHENKRRRDAEEENA